MNVSELFDRCYEIATGQPDATANRRMHETLVLACAEGTKGTGQGFGNVFSQVDFLCKRHRVATGDRRAIQTMRRHSNRSEPLSREDLLYDVRALCLFISAVFCTSVPGRLLRVIPTENKLGEKGQRVNSRYIRCVVRRWSGETLDVVTDDDELRVDITGQEGLPEILWEGMQLNLLDCHVSDGLVVPRLVVVEPDFLVDISAVAACFTDYGHHPLAYTVNRLRERANSQAILLGNFASSALDDIINGHFNVNDTIMDSFKEQALQFCACQRFSASDFVRDARQQAANLVEVVDILFSQYDREKAILEPSFVCERLGLQGRVDLMTTDGTLLVEQKSGKNMCIERRQQNQYHSYYREDHYVQLLLYYGVLRYNFQLGDQRVDIRLLYSKYPAESGLLVVSFYQALFREAIRFRNQLVANEYRIAREGFGAVLPSLAPETLNQLGKDDFFFRNYIRPQTEQVTAPLHRLTPLEHAYFTRMMTFVYREQLMAKVGGQEGQGGCVADLWNMPLSEKRETGNIYTGLRLTEKRRSGSYNGYDLLTLAVPDQGDDFLPNFRRGDMVYLYAYQEPDEPDVRQNILYRGTLCEIHDDRVVVRLDDGQQNPGIFDVSFGGSSVDGCRRWAMEHGGGDASTTGAVRGLHQFVTAPRRRKDLLLGQRVPEADTSLRLSRSYHPDYDHILLSAKRARDYFLLVGPPGTGKTSMALRFLVEEELCDPGAGILLMSYTNRAVDEICGMLTEAGLDFLRLGSETSCDPRFRRHLLDEAIGATPKLESIRERILHTPILVATTSMLQSRPFVFDLRRFSLAIVDEASQILEPSIVGLLAAHRQGECRIGRFILIGDHKQLPAVVQQDKSQSRTDETLLREVGLTDCRDSLFERLLRWERQTGREQFTGILRKQGRMHPEIAEFPNRMFYFRERLEPVPCAHQLEPELGYTLPSLDALDDLLKERRMIFFPSVATAVSSDKVNPDEARIVAQVMSRIHRFYGSRFDADRTLGVIVPYRNQIAMIRREIAKYHIPELERVSIDTVERYQGSQRDVIIYSFTVQRLYQLDFLTGNCLVEEGRTIDRKLNVAITRARKQMIMTGNPEILSANPVFAELIRRYRI